MALVLSPAAKSYTSFADTFETDDPPAVSENVIPGETDEAESDETASEEPSEGPDGDSYGKENKLAFTNRYLPPPPPGTGDASRSSLYLAMMLAALLVLGFGCTVFGRRKKR